MSKPTINTNTFALALIAMASNFVGLTEASPNAKWEDTTTKASEKDKSDLLVLEMGKVSGWTPGAAYCAAFDGAMVNLTLDKLGFKDAGEVFLKSWTAHCMTNVRKMESRGLLKPVTEPSVGALMLHRHGKTDSGHAGIVASVDGTYPNRMLACIEGNTSKGSAGDQRQGDGIFLKARNVNKNGTLITQGFLPVEAILTLAGFQL